jgi:hypothetical protein
MKTTNTSSDASVSALITLTICEGNDPGEELRKKNNIELPAIRSRRT